MTHQDSYETEPRRDMELWDSSQDKTWIRRDKTCISRLYHCATTTQL